MQDFFREMWEGPNWTWTPGIPDSLESGIRVGGFGTLSHVCFLPTPHGPEKPGGRIHNRTVLDKVRGGWDGRLERDPEAHELSSSFCPYVLRSWSPRRPWLLPRQPAAVLIEPLLAAAPPEVRVSSSPWMQKTRRVEHMLTGSLETRRIQRRMGRCRWMAGLREMQHKQPGGCRQTRRHR